jgi:hypothetical protein
LATCRFCQRAAEEDWLVKYGTRHYAHPDCYLDAGKKVENLSEWEQKQFDEKDARLDSTCGTKRV